MVKKPAGGTTAAAGGSPMKPNGTPPPSATGGGTPPAAIARDLEQRLRKAPDWTSLLDVLGDAQRKCRELHAGSLPSILNTLAIRANSDLQKLPEAEASAESEALLRAGESFLEAAIALNQGRPPEAAVTAMVRLCCASLGTRRPDALLEGPRPAAKAALRRALGLVEEARAAGMKPKLRTLSAILSGAAEVGDLETCEAVWAQLPALGLEPQDAEFAAMLRGIRQGKCPDRRRRQDEVLKQILEELPLPSDPPLVEEIGQAFGVADVAALQGAETPHAEGRSEDGRRWHVGWTSVDDDGICALSSRCLQALGVTPSEEEELMNCAARLANDSGKNRGFRNFQRWLESQEPFDIIIDGANVGFNNQNHEGGHFQYRQIDTVVQRFVSEGRRVLLVLHPKWLREDADLSVVRKKRKKLDPISCAEAPPQAIEEEEEEDAEVLPFPHDGVTEAERLAEAGSPLRAIRSWKEAGVLLRVPTHDCDDWYWLYAALDSLRRGVKHVQVVSNDHMRDHHWRMLSCKAFVRWQGRHMTRVCLRTEADDPSECTLILSPPQPFSVRSQVSSDGKAWHFPVPVIKSRAEQLQSGRPVAQKEIESAEYRWLVAWQDRDGT